MILEFLQSLSSCYGLKSYYYCYGLTSHPLHSPLKNNFYILNFFLSSTKIYVVGTQKSCLGTLHIVFSCWIIVQNLIKIKQQIRKLCSRNKISSLYKNLVMCSLTKVNHNFCIKMTLCEALKSTYNVWLLAVVVWVVQLLE